MRWVAVLLWVGLPPQAVAAQQDCAVQVFASSRAEMAAAQTQDDQYRVTFEAFLALNICVAATLPLQCIDAVAVSVDEVCALEVLSLQTKKADGFDVPVIAQHVAPIYETLDSLRAMACSDTLIDDVTDTLNSSVTALRALCDIQVAVRLTANLELWDLMRQDRTIGWVS